MTDRLVADFDEMAWGYAQLSDIDDYEIQAVVSDQVLATTWSVGTNLIEASLHKSQAARIAAPGLGFARPESWNDDRLEDITYEMHVGGFFRAFGSVLDCLAAVVIGIERLPRSIQKAASRNLHELGEIANVAERRDGPSDQLACWRRLDGLIDGVVGGSPFPGWLEWADEMRNALVHRGRHIDVQLPRSQDRPLVVLAERPDELAAAITLLDHHFHSRPWLPEMVHLADTDTERAAWFEETASVTLEGLFAELNDLVERVCQELLRVWAAVADGDLALPAPPRAAQTWSPPADLELTFRGFQTQNLVPVTATNIRVNPATARRIALVERLRQRRAGTASS